MRRLLTAIWLSTAVWLWGMVGVAQEGRSTFERLSIGATAVGLAATTTNPTGRAQMTKCSARLQQAPIYFRDDGTDPTSSVGSPLEVGDVLTITGNTYARTLRFIASTSNSAVLAVHCYP